MGTYRLISFIILILHHLSTTAPPFFKKGAFAASFRDVIPYYCKEVGDYRATFPL